MYADLHLHSTASDGVLKPAELVGKAKKLGFSAIALTDHDTVSGIAEAEAAGEALGIEVIAGIELSAIDNRVQGEVEVHILGYFIDPEHKKLLKVLKLINKSRTDRAVIMVKKLNEIGISIALDRVLTLAEGESLGRPHIARTMVEAGYISDVKEAFSKDYIGRGGRAYVERYKISPHDAIKLIIEAGGVPVLAHPGYLSDRTALTEYNIIPYIESGLKGIEVFYSQHTLQQVSYYREIALKYGLLVTGGSDYHGDGLFGMVKLPDQYVEALTDANK